jgi:hypothetical protein
MSRTFGTPEGDEELEFVANYEGPLNILKKDG